MCHAVTGQFIFNESLLNKPVGCSVDKWSASYSYFPQPSSIRTMYSDLTKPYHTTNTLFQKKYHVCLPQWNTSRCATMAIAVAYSIHIIDSRPLMNIMIDLWSQRRDKKFIEVCEAACYEWLMK